MKPSKGKILISEPYLPDYNFHRSVVLLCDHDKEGTVGFVLNKMMVPTLSDALSGEDFPELPLFEGGPVETDSLFYIHNYGNAIKGSLPINDKLSWGGDFEEVSKLIKEGVIDEGNIKLFVGYSGWSPMQLEEEMQSNSWFVSEVDNKTILTANDDTLWKEAVANLSSKDKIWANAPANPMLN